MIFNLFVVPAPVITSKPCNVVFVLDKSALMVLPVAVSVPVVNETTVPKAAAAAAAFDTTVAAAANVASAAVVCV